MEDFWEKFAQQNSAGILDNLRRDARMKKQFK